MGPRSETGLYIDEPSRKEMATDPLRQWDSIWNSLTSSGLSSGSGHKIKKLLLLLCAWNWPIIFKGSAGSCMVGFICYIT